MLLGGRLTLARGKNKTKVSPIKGVVDHFVGETLEEFKARKKGVGLEPTPQHLDEVEHLPTPGASEPLPPITQNELSWLLAEINAHIASTGTAPEADLESSTRTSGSAKSRRPHLVLEENDARVARQREAPPDPSLHQLEQPSRLPKAARERLEAVSEAIADHPELVPLIRAKCDEVGPSSRIEGTQRPNPLLLIMLERVIERYMSGDLKGPDKGKEKDRATSFAEDCRTLLRNAQELDLKGVSFSPGEAGEIGNRLQRIVNEFIRQEAKLKPVVSTRGSIEAEQEGLLRRRIIESQDVNRRRCLDEARQRINNFALVGTLGDLNANRVQTNLINGLVDAGGGCLMLGDIPVTLECLEKPKYPRGVFRLRTADSAHTSLYERVVSHRVACP